MMNMLRECMSISVLDHADWDDTPQEQIDILGTVPFEKLFAIASDVCWWSPVGSG